MAEDVIALSPADWWELQKRGADVENAELRVLLARAMVTECQRKLLAAHGATDGGSYQFVLAPPENRARDDG